MRGVVCGAFYPGRFCAPPGLADAELIDAFLAAVEKDGSLAAAIEKPTLKCVAAPNADRITSARHAPRSRRKQLSPRGAAQRGCGMRRASSVCGVTRC